MIQVRKSNERGGGDYGWLKTKHTFSFNDYWDEQVDGIPFAARDQRGPRRAGRGLRHASAPRHGDHHLRARRRARAQGQHRERLGDPARRRAAHERRHRRRHSEFNPSQTEPVHFLQIWILPEKTWPRTRATSRRVFRKVRSVASCA